MKHKHKFSKGGKILAPKLKGMGVGVKFSPFIICSGDIWRDAEAKNPPSGHPRDLF